jgi:hypothetical protein
MKTKLPTVPALAIDIRSIPRPDRLADVIERFTDDGETIELIDRGVLNWESKSGIPLMASAAYQFFRLESNWSALLMTLRVAPRSRMFFGPWGSLSVFSPVATEQGGTSCHAVIRFSESGGPRFQCECGSRVYRLFLDETRTEFLCQKCVGHTGPVAVAN